MDENKQRLIDIQCEQCKNALSANGFHADIAEDAEAACRIVNDIIKDGDVVCDGGSQTLWESGIIAMLEQRNILFHSHNRPFASRAESDAEARKAFSADVFLASANAITQNGEIINVDGHGNRVSAMMKHVPLSESAELQHRQTVSDCTEKLRALSLAYAETVIIRIVFVRAM